MPRAQDGCTQSSVCEEPVSGGVQPTDCVAPPCAGKDAGTQQLKNQLQINREVTTEENWDIVDTSVNSNDENSA